MRQWRMRSLLAILLALACGACDGTADGADASVADAGASDAAVNCRSPEEVSFPTFDWPCATASDCEVVVHQRDCCGNLRQMAIATVNADAFAAAEAICEGQYGPCGCPAHDAGFCQNVAECHGGRCLLVAR